MSILLLIYEAVNVERLFTVDWNEYYEMDTVKSLIEEPGS